MTTTAQTEPDEILVGIQEFTYSDHGTTRRDATHVTRWSHINFDHPVPLLLVSDLHAGDVVQTAMGTRLYVESISFKVTGNPSQVAWIKGRLHGSPDGPIAHPSSHEVRSSLPLLARGGVEFGKTPEVPAVPITQHEKDTQTKPTYVGGQTIERRAK